MDTAGGAYPPAGAVSTDAGQVLQEITRFYQLQGRGPTIAELKTLRPFRPYSLTDALRLLKYRHLVLADSGGRLVPLNPEDRPATLNSRILTAEELERILNGQPSTGEPPRLGTLPEAVTQRPLPALPAVVVRRRRRSKPREGEQVATPADRQRVISLANQLTSAYQLVQAEAMLKRAKQTLHEGDVDGLAAACVLVGCFAHFAGHIAGADMVKAYSELETSAAPFEERQTAPDSH